MATFAVTYAVIVGKGFVFWLAAHETVQLGITSTYGAYFYFNFREGIDMACKTQDTPDCNDLLNSVYNFRWWNYLIWTIALSASILPNCKRLKQSADKAEKEDTEAAKIIEDMGSDEDDPDSMQSSLI